MRPPSESSRSSSRAKGNGMIELNKMSAIEAKLDALTHRLDKRMHSTNEIGAVEREGRLNNAEGRAEEGSYAMEEANYLNEHRAYHFKPNPNLPTHYTPALRNHENLSYGGGAQHVPRHGQNFQQGYAPLRFQQQQQGEGRNEYHSQKRTQTFEDQMLQFMGGNKKLLNFHEQRFAELEASKTNSQIFQTTTNASLKNLETQIGQLALTLQNQIKDAFPSDMKKNPKVYKAVQLRSGKELEKEKLEKDESNKGEGILENAESPEKERKKEQQQQEERSKKKAHNSMHAVPFRQRLQKTRIEEQFAKFLKTFHKLEISMTFKEAVTQMPLYAKFLKEILSKKRRFAKEGVVNLTATCSTVIKKNLPEKIKDPRSFTIPCTIRGFEIKKALCDSGASINLMPLSVARKLSLGKLTPTTITLQMADRKMAKPEGVIEDVLVKVGKFVFPVDFIILDIEEDSQVPVLLGRPFLATGAALIDMQKGVHTLRVGEEATDFNLLQSLKNLDTDREDYKLVDEVYLNNSDCYYDCNAQLPINENELIFQYLEGVNSDFSHISLHSTEKVLSLKQNSMDNGDNNEEKEFHQETSAEGLVLKELPSHLKYAYLELPKSKPVIISARLSDAEEQKLLKILKNYQESIAWSIDELNGISPSICMHKILLEENAKPSVEHQRRLNPVMKEVVKKEVLKWLNAGFIYAISDSP